MPTAPDPLDPHFLAQLRRTAREGTNRRRMIEDWIGQLTAAEARKPLAPGCEWGGGASWSKAFRHARPVS